MTDEEIIQKAGHEWDKLRGDMRSYLAIVIRIAREAERKKCEKERANSGRPDEKED